MKKIFFGLLLFLVFLNLGFSADVTCEDGTKLGQCSVKSPGKYCGGSYLNPYLDYYIKKCPCEAVPGWVQQGTGDNAICVKKTCSDGTAEGECSLSKPKQCVNGVLINNASKCGCPEGKRKSSDGINCESLFCKDGSYNVDEGSCSPLKPKKCVNGVLINKASECGCPTGTIKEGENCIKVCSDNTKEGECSSSKPKQCVNGVLINNASKCGCPEGKKPKDNDCVSDNPFFDQGTQEQKNEASSESSSQFSNLCCCCFPAALLVVAFGASLKRREEF
jgi:hypothetical protein